MLPSTVTATRRILPPAAQPTIDVVAYCETLAKELYFVPVTGNLGDALITAGTYSAFAKAGVPLKPWDKKTIHKNMALLVGAAGNLVPAYGETAGLLSRLMKMPVSDVVILPATIQGYEALLRQLDQRFHFFCRDLVSYNHLCRLRGGARVFLDHDMATRLDAWQLLGEADLLEMRGGLGPNGLRITERILRLAASHALQGRGRGRLFRADKEAGGAPRDLASFDLSALCIRRWEDEATTVLISAAFLRAISLFDSIETDRLHVGIAGGLLGLPVKLYANSYYKNRAIFDFSLQSKLPSISFVEHSSAQAERGLSFRIPARESFGYTQRLDVEGMPLWVRSRQVPLQLSPEALGSAFLIPEAKRGRQLIGPEVDAMWQAGAGKILEKVSGWWNYRASPPQFQKTTHMPPHLGRKTGLAFSLGIDSFYTCFFADPAPDLLFYVAGYDVSLTDRATLSAYQDSIKTVARALGREWAFVETNLREHPVFNHCSWEHTHGGAIAFVGHLLKDRIDSLLVSSSYHRDSLGPWGSHPEIDEHWSSSGLRVMHYGDDVPRSEKLRQLVSHPIARQLFADHVRVCFEKPTEQGNCGVCSKCTLLRINLLRDAPDLKVRTLPEDIPLVEAIDSLPPIVNQLSINFRKELLDIPDTRVRAALQRFIERSEAKIGEHSVFTKSRV